MKTIKDIEGKGRYLTIGIDRGLSVHIQIILWKILEDYKLTKLIEARKDEIDPLQIFEIEVEAVEKKLHIRHKQEEPEYEKEHVVTGIEVDPKKQYNGKIYIIDNEVNGMTMMWSVEY